MLIPHFSWWHGLIALLTSWTTVKTWATETVTDPKLNTHLRDNTQYLYEQKGNPRSYVAKTANYTALVTDGLIDCTSGTFTVTLPAAATAGSPFTLTVKNSGAGVITVDANGAETIDGALTVTMVQYDSLTLTSTGTAWVIL